MTAFFRLEPCQSVGDFGLSLALLERVRDLLAKAFQLGSAQLRGLELRMIDGIDRLAVDLELEVQVCAGRAAA